MDKPRTVRLLVAEDDAAYLYLIEKAFSRRAERTQWVLTIARDGEEAVQVLFEEEKDAVPLPI